MSLLRMLLYLQELYVQHKKLDIFIYCNWVVTGWQWLVYMYTKYEIDYY
jgi:hypothetical protein